MASYTERLYIGIDPGINGGAVVLDKNARDIIEIYDWESAGTALSFLETMKEGDLQIRACIERVGGFIKGNPAPGSAMFKLGENFGIWQGLLQALKIPFYLVRPQEWQKNIPNVHGLTGKERKRALKAEALRRFPDDAKSVTLKNCDALLIANYLVERMRG